MGQLENYPIAVISTNSLQLFNFCNFCGHTRVVMVQIAYARGQ
jgi:hypothetical protein